MPSLADLQKFLNELNVFSKIDLDALLRDVGTFTPCLKQIQAIVRDARETADDVLAGDVRAVLDLAALRRVAEAADLPPKAPMVRTRWEREN